MATAAESLFWELCLENTRLLVKGVECLHTGYERKQRARDPDCAPSWKINALRKFVTEEYRQSIQDGEYLAQNPYTELFRFRFPTPNDARMDAEDGLRLSGMILLYHQLQILENLSPDQLAEEYEILCNSIRSILGADMCYLVSRHLTDTRMLCASSIMKDNLDIQLGSREAGELLDQLKEDGEFLSPVTGVFLRKEGAGDGIDTLVLPIMLYDKKGTPGEEQVYFICQRSDGTKQPQKRPYWSHDIRQTIFRVRDTLFLRGKLAQALIRDLTSLLTVAREFRSIHRRSPENGPLKILHISDLHVTASNYNQFKTDIEKLKLEDGPFDFLVITGDVVQGRYAAGDLEQNYDHAAEVIRALAMRMWGEDQDGERVLRQDWKRRTIVIPGNHDYASMNELETQHGENHRVSESGRPATKEGSAMAKFTYYINFVRKLLDIEIGELIDNSLNELRCYDKMGVAFLCFNTSVMANPARNNKVHLDQVFACRAIRRLSAEKEKKAVVFLGHHGPSYKIDYVADEYLEPFICKQITEDFTKALRAKSSKDPGKEKSPEEQKNELIDLEKRMNDRETLCNGDIVENSFVQAWLLKNEPKELPLDVTGKVIERRKKTRLYDHLEFLIDQLKKSELERSINERYQKIIAEVRRAELLSEKDQDYYREIFRELEDCLKPIICLSGHTHDWESDEEERAENHYVAKRFSWVKTVRKSLESRELEQVRYLNYGVCEIPAERPCSKDKIKYHEKEEKLNL